MSNSSFTFPRGTKIGNPKGEYHTLENLQKKGFNLEHQLTTRPFNKISWSTELVKQLLSLSSNTIAQFAAHQIEGGNTSPTPFKPYRQTISNIPTSVGQNTEVDDVIKRNKNNAAIMAINSNFDKDHYEAYSLIRLSVKDWEAFLLDDSNDSNEDNRQGLTDNINNTNHEYSDYRVGIDIFKMTDRLINFSKGPATTSAPIRLFETMGQLSNFMDSPIIGDLQETSAQAFAYLTAVYNAFEDYDPNTTATQTSLDPFVTHMILCKMKGEENYKKYYFNRCYHPSDTLYGNTLPTTVKSLMADIRRYHSEHIDHNSDNLNKQGLKRSGNSGTQVKEYSNKRTEDEDQSELESEGIQRHKKRKVESNKRRKAAKNKKKIEQSAPTGRPIKDKDRSHNGHSPEAMKSIKKIRDLKKNKPSWNSDDKSKWINKADKTGCVCVNCQGTKYEYTHPTDKCRVPRGQNAPTGKSKSPYTLDNAFDHKGWANGKNGMDDSNSKDN